MEAIREAPYGIQAFVADLRAIAARTQSDSEIIEAVRPLALKLAADPHWVEPGHYACDEAQGFGVHLLHEEPDHTLAVFAIAWLPGRGAPPHNHATWAVVAGVDGPERNVFWRRVDDGSREGYAKIEQAGAKTFRAGDVVSLLPDAIHSVTNETEQVTLSLHVYGKHINHTGRFTYNPDTDTVQPFVVREA